MSSEHDESSPVLGPATALVVLPVVIGVLVGVALTVIAGGFAVLSGVTGSAGGPAAQPSLYMPKYSPTPTPTPSEYQEPTPTATPTEKTKKTKKTKVDSPDIELFASPLDVNVNERIDLNGIYLNGDGAVLQVQRKAGGKWGDFPVTVTVSSGSFSTYVKTGRTGEQKFRVIDPATGRKSNVVTVTVS